MVMDNLLKGLTDSGFELINFAYELAIMVFGFDDKIISSRL